MAFEKILFALLFVTVASTSVTGSERQNPQSPSTGNSLVLLLQSFLQQQQQQQQQQQIFPFSTFLSQAGNIANIAALINTFSQAVNATQPQSTGVGALSQNPIYTTLPFEDQNLTQLVSIWNNFADSLKPALPEEDGSDMGRRPEVKLGGSNQTILADLNFSTLPQLFQLVGRR